MTDIEQERRLQFVQAHEEILYPTIHRRSEEREHWIKLHPMVAALAHYITLAAAILIWEQRLAQAYLVVISRSSLTISGQM